MRTSMSTTNVHASKPRPAVSTRLRLTPKALHCTVRAQRPQAAHLHDVPPRERHAACVTSSHVGEGIRGHTKRCSAGNPSRGTALHCSMAARSTNVAPTAIMERYRWVHWMLECRLCIAATRMIRSCESAVCVARQFDCKQSSRRTRWVE